jgi:hypothetical protein
MLDAELSNTTPPGAALSLQQRPTHPHRARNPARCRFFGTKKGVSRTSCAVPFPFAYVLIGGCTLFPPWVFCFDLDCLRRGYHLF